jgi:RES domain-containing protein
VLVYRLTKPEFAPGLDGVGARLAGGRWNSPGVAVVYCATSPSLAALEFWVHLPAAMRTRQKMPLLTLVTVDVPDDAPVEEVRADLAELNDPEATRRAGDMWLGSARSLALIVPSVVIPQDRNVLLNPAHSDKARLRHRTEPFHFDRRMAASGEI